MFCPPLPAVSRISATVPVMSRPDAARAVGPSLSTFVVQSARTTAFADTSCAILGAVAERTWRVRWYQFPQIVTGAAAASILAPGADARAAIVVGLLAVAWRWPIAVVAGRRFDMVLDGPIVFTALLVLPQATALTGIALGSAVGLPLLLEPRDWRRWWSCIVQASVYAVAAAGAVLVIPTTDQPEVAQLLARGAAACATYVAVMVVLQLGLALIDGDLPVRQASAAIAPPVVTGGLSFCLAATAALASRHAEWGPLLLAPPLFAVVAASRRFLRAQEGATHDALTGLANRRALDSALRAAIARLSRRGEPFAVVVVDLDLFKAVNDQFGHAAGDAVLVRIARRLEAASRTEDVVARTGGDEFTLVLSGVDAAAAVATCERLLAACSEKIPLDDGNVARVGASIGVAVFDKHALPHDPNEALAAADDAAYEAKRGGRGLVRVSTSRTDRTRGT